MFFLSEYSCIPPAIASTCITVVGHMSEYGPGLLTLPVTNTLRLLIFFTTTVTFGSSTNFSAAAVRFSLQLFRSQPGSLNSFSSGSEIRPSGRTSHFS